MKPADLSLPERFADRPHTVSRERLAAMALAICFHIGVLWVIVHGFGGVPALIGKDKGALSTRTFDVPLEQPKPSPSPKAPDPAGASGEEGRKAKPSPTLARARVPAPEIPAPTATSTGSEARSGAVKQGDGTGGGGQGMGTGSGSSGDGSGGGQARKPEKLAGDIRSTRDYPASTQAQRIGKRVVIVLTVGIDGRVSDCKVWRASGVPEADAVTCKLATERFRFRPATNANGDPVAATYGWEQRWFEP